MSGWTPLGPAILFTPADRADRFDKAAERADMVILDLEDGCQPANREQARRAIEACELDPAKVIVRINPPHSTDGALDLASVARTPFRQVMVPKAEGTADIAAVTAVLNDAQVIALIETPRGVLRADDVAEAPAVVAMFWGAEDLVAGLSGTASRHADGTYRDVAKHARARVQLAAAAFDKAALDSVYIDIPNKDGLRAEVEDAAALGYAATVCIHPSQVEVIREAYQPTPEKVEWATRLLKEAEKNQGAFSFDGRMVDEPLFRQAQAIINRVRTES
ncbi:Citrate lyase subunit beta-like protein [Corynebacterium kalinowskii]|uniref:Citrate lyase subunit beta-like protein n=1 Tax=Corynebacterium kalinowskii TaxID=2675216 RepID=A0A6B8VMA6_9CORY|nr:CoA ester lyase [Corynebacterium kalinowskii]QGU02554.1 Citrate lyase subunit beta-like protein [Corynebacterium kalinowskii]